MRILLIGNFSLPYEEENLHNLTLLNHLNQEGYECHVINIAESQSEYNESLLEKKKIIKCKSYVDFIIKFIRYGYRSNVIHFLTKGYTRPGLMKLVTAVFIGKLLLKKIIITLHSEMFSIFGQLRSKMGGQQLLHLSFSMADKIICGDIHTYEVAATHYEIKDKFIVIPSFFQIPEDTDKVKTALRKLENQKKVIVFSGVKYPSLIFDVLNGLLTKYISSDIGIAISFSEKKSQQLQHAIEEAGSMFVNNMVFIEHDDKQLLTTAYARANLVIRTLSCDGKPLFNDIAISVKEPMRSGNYLHFPISLILIKEGKVTNLCAYIFNKLLIERIEALPEPSREDFYAKIKEIYSEYF